MSYFPMMVDLQDKNILVVGGGNEGTAKVEVLHKFGAHITVVGVSVSERIRQISDTVFERKFEDGDILHHEYTLVVAATDDAAANKKISDLCRERKIPVNVVDNPPLCTFIFPAIVKDREVVCAVSSGGKSPYITQYVKKKIRDVLPEDIGMINDRMGEIRAQAKREIPDKEERRKFLRRKLDDMLS